LKTTYPSVPLICIAYSFGANNLCNYLAKHDSKYVDLAFSVSNPYDWAEVWRDRCESNFMLKNLYDKSICYDFLDIVRKHKELVLTEKSFDFDIEKLLKCSSLGEVDHIYTIKAHREEKYRDIVHYYEHSSSGNKIGQIKIPVVFIHAEDDPVTRVAPFDKVIKGNREKENFMFVRTKNGGHIGFLNSFKSESWADHVVLEYIEYFLEKRGESKKKQ